MSDLNHTSDTASLGFVYINTDPSDPQIGEVVRYDQFVQKLFKKQDVYKMTSHALRGVCTEAGELTDAFKKHLDYEKELNIENVIEELGDLEFYMQVVRNLYNIPQQVVLQYNAEKLGKRYKGLAYSDLAAHLRADKNGNGS